VNKQSEKFVVISGGAGGIGRSAALKLAELRYYPILLDRDEDACKKTSAMLKVAGFESGNAPRISRSGACPCILCRRRVGHDMPFSRDFLIKRIVQRSEAHRR